MKKLNKKKFLAQAVLASSFFAAHAFANNITVVTAGPVTTTAADPVIDVFQTGRIDGGGNDGAQAAVPNSIIIIEPDNYTVDSTHPNAFYAINSSNGGGAAINILSGASNSQVTINQHSGATGLNAAGIFISGGNSVINNSGVIQTLNTGSNSSVIAIEANGVTINNKSAGIIQDLGTSSNPVISMNNVSPTSTFINNQGKIQSQSNAAATIQFSGPAMGHITNSGIIQNIAIANTTANHVISFTNALVSSTPFVITNEKCGLIYTSTQGDGIFLGTAVAGATNIQNDGTISVNTGSAIFITNSSGSIINTGTLSSSSTTGTINLAAGTISNNLSAPIGINNSGTIVNNTANGNAINLAGGYATLRQIDGQITGNILLAQYGSGGTNDNNVFYMTGGTVKGGITASNMPSTNILHLQDGLILGNVNLSTNPNNTDQVFLDNTDVQGGIFGGPGNNTFTIGNLGPAFGGFTELQGSAFISTTAGNDILNINNSFTSNGLINFINSININKGIYTQNLPISELAFGGTGITVNDGATMIQNANISGNTFLNSAGIITVMPGGTYIVNRTPIIDFTQGGFNGTSFDNQGILEIGSVGMLTIEATSSNSSDPIYYGASGSVYKPHLEGYGGPLSAGELFVINSDTTAQPTSGIIFDTGSFVAPVLDGGFIPKGQVFTIAVDADANAISDSSTLIQPSSSITFIKQFAPTTNSIVQLVAGTTGFTGNSQTVTLANALNAFAATVPTFTPTSTVQTGVTPAGFNPNLLGLIGELQRFGTTQEVQNALNSALPHYNYGLIAASKFILDATLDTTLARLENLFLNKGISHGDYSPAVSGWVKPFAGKITQNNDDGIDGYDVDAVGVIAGVDWYFSPNILLGMAGSYAKTDLDDKNDFAPKNADVTSWEASVYGVMEYRQDWIIDAAFGFAGSDYDTRRFTTLNAGDMNQDNSDPCFEAPFTAVNSFALGDFEGTSYGAQMNVGWKWIVNEQYYAIPFARLKYLHVEMDDYIESGAGVFNLNVSNDDAEEFLAGLGIRMGGQYKWGKVVYVPEMIAMIAYDFANDGQGVSFGFTQIPQLGLLTTPSVAPSRNILDIGVGLNAYLAPHSVFSIKGDWEVREGYTRSVGWLGYRYLW